jgi:hypothetical protein
MTNHLDNGIEFVTSMLMIRLLEVFLKISWADADILVSPKLNLINLTFVHMRSLLFILLCMLFHVFNKTCVKNNGSINK